MCGAYFCFCFFLFVFFFKIFFGGAKKLQWWIGMVGGYGGGGMVCTSMSAIVTTMQRVGAAEANGGFCGCVCDGEEEGLVVVVAVVVVVVELGGWLVGWLSNRRAQCSRCAMRRRESLGEDAACIAGTCRRDHRLSLWNMDSCIAPNGRKLAMGFMLQFQFHVSNHVYCMQC